MILLALLSVVGVTVAAQNRGHYIVDYQRLPLYHEFYLSPGLYRPLFPGSIRAGGGGSSGLESRGFTAVPASALRRQELTKAGRTADGGESGGDSESVVITSAQSGSQTVDTHPVLSGTHPALSGTHPALSSTHPGQVITHPALSSTHPSQVTTHPELSNTQTTGAQPGVGSSGQHPTPSGPVAPSEPAALPPVLSYSNSMTTDGSYSYRYDTGDGQSREESSVMEPTGEDGRLVPVVHGSYTYPGPDGRTVRVNYVADSNGFRASGDHLPQGVPETLYSFKYVIP